MKNLDHLSRLKAATILLSDVYPGVTESNLHELLEETFLQPLITAGEAARRFCVKKSLINALMDDGHLFPVELQGGFPLFRVHEVKAALEAMK